ncbi:sugar kinase [Companilactobacillus zhachilii]|uniref:Sugar kinase n=1 Tax=Companilactobacillus zhachilii TaxID=2304606 RepID=A0A386PQ52_9LACO|nr:sugar kinase [Companilactobacillus zhachilii]AYE37258.1 sugar kinase [Companilactobacillus zhachilii]
MKSFLTIGEPLIVFSSEDLNAELMDAKHFKKYLAGAELNVAVGVSRLGIESRYITAIGNDPLGQSIKREVEQNGIHTNYIETNNDYWTGFYLKQRVDKGDPDIFYYRKNSAASHYNTDSLEKIDFENVGLIHCSGIMAAISENGYRSVEKLMDMANDREIVTTYDPNIRPQLWLDKQEMKQKLNYLASKAVIVMPGIHEGEQLVGTDDPEDIADFYLNQSSITQAVVIKAGPSGAYLKVRGEQLQLIDGYRVENVVDTVGAGDGFAVGMISGLLEDIGIKNAVKRACAIGALAVQDAGDSDGYPTRMELDKFMGVNNG